MAITVKFELTDELLASLKETPEEFARELRLAAAVKWYELGRVSQAKAAAIADMSRSEFFAALSRYGVSPLQETPEELERDFAQ